MQRRVNAVETLRKQEASVVPFEVPKVLPQNVAGYAVDFFLSYYVCGPKYQDTPCGLFDCLYPIWSKSSESSPLRSAVTAVALVLLDAWSQVKPNQPLSASRSQYVRSVESLRKYIAASNYASDETIMAALILNMYDNLLSFFVSQQHGGLHMAGSTALIKSRMQNPVEDELSKRMILETRNQIIGRALKQAQTVPPIVTSWASTIDVPTNPTLQLDMMGTELAKLQSLATQLSEQTEVPKEMLIQVLSQAEELDQLYASWNDGLLQTWKPVRVSGVGSIPQSVRDVGLYQDYCDVYPNFWIGNSFNTFYSSRIKLHLIIILLSKLLDPDLIEQRVNASLQIIQPLADDMCASVPFYLGDRNTPGRLDDRTVQYPSIPGHSAPKDHHIAAGAFGGFHICMQVSGLFDPRIALRPGQKQWIGGQIARVKRICNIVT